MSELNGVLELPEVVQVQEVAIVPFKRPARPAPVEAGKVWRFEGEFVMFDFLELAELDKAAPMQKMIGISAMMSNFLVEWPHPLDPTKPDSALWLKPTDYQEAQKRFLEWANGTFQA